MARGAGPLGWSVRQVPLADGGEGLLDALASLGGERRRWRWRVPSAGRWWPSGCRSVTGGGGGDGPGLRAAAGRRGGGERPPGGDDPGYGPAHRGRGPVAVGCRGRPGGRGGAGDGGGGPRWVGDHRWRVGARWRPSRRRGGWAAWSWSVRATSTSGSSRPRPGSGPRRGPIRSRWRSSRPGWTRWPTATSTATGSTCGPCPGPGPPGGSGEPSSPSGAASGRATTVVTELLGFGEALHRQPGGGHRRGGLRRHLPVGQGGGLGAARRHAGRVCLRWWWPARCRPRRRRRPRRPGPRWSR